MNILESEIEEILFKNLDNRKLLKERGFDFFEQKYYLHPNLGSYGIPDIVGVTVNYCVHSRSRSINVTIYELKKEVVNINTLLQAARYAKGIERFFDENSITLNFNEIDFSLVLIGKNIDESSDFVFLTDFCYNVNLVTYSVDLNYGIVFREQKGYYKRNEQQPVLNTFISDLLHGKCHYRRKQL